MNIGNRIKQRRCELGMSQSDLADKMGYSDRSTITRIEHGEIDLAYSKIVKFASVLEMPIEELAGIEPTVQISNTPIIKEKQKVDSRERFSTNLRVLMTRANKSRKEISEAIGVSYITFSDWCTGKKYPRIEKLEALASYFGIPVSELVGEENKNSQNEKLVEIEKNQLLDIILRLHTDEEFLKVIEKVSILEKEKFNALQLFLNAFAE